MPKDLNQISAPAPKDKKMAAVGIALERLLHEQGQAVEALAHVRMARGQPHAHTGRNGDHRRARTAMTRASAAPFTSLSTITRQPPTSTISITPRAPAPDDAVAASGAAGRHAGPGVRGVAGSWLATMAGTNVSASASAVSRPSLSNRRQVNSWLGVKPCRRAVADTIRGARSLSATIRRFSARVHRRRAPVVITSNRETDDIGVCSVMRLCLKPSAPYRKAALPGRIRSRRCDLRRKRGLPVHFCERNLAEQLSMSCLEPELTSCRSCC